MNSKSIEYICGAAGAVGVAWAIAWMVVTKLRSDRDILLGRKDLVPATNDDIYDHEEKDEETP